MIGHYLLTLCPDAEEAILTGKMAPFNYGNDEQRCLVGWAADVEADVEYVGRRFLWVNTYWKFNESIENRYDALCERFGTARVNKAIRERIFLNKMRRAWKATEQPATV